MCREGFATPNTDIICYVSFLTICMFHKWVKTIFKINSLILCTASAVEIRHLVSSVNFFTPLQTFVMWTARNLMSRTNALWLLIFSVTPLCFVLSQAFAFTSLTLFTLLQNDILSLLIFISIKLFAVNFEEFIFWHFQIIHLTILWFRALGSTW